MPTRGTALPPAPPRPGRRALGLLEISLEAQGPVPNLYFSVSLGIPQRAAAVSAKRTCLALVSGSPGGMADTMGGGTGGELRGPQCGLEVPTVVSPCLSQGSCSCCGRRARPWCTPAAWTGLCGSGTPAQGR